MTVKPYQTRDRASMCALRRRPPRAPQLMFTTAITWGDCEQQLASQSSRACLAPLTAVYGGLSDIDRADYRLGAAELRALSLVHGAVMLWVDQLDSAASEAEFVGLVGEITAGLG